MSSGCIPESYPLEFFFDHATKYVKYYERGSFKSRLLERDLDIERNLFTNRYAVMPGTYWKCGNIFLVTKHFSFGVFRPYGEYVITTGLNKVYISTWSDVKSTVTLLPGRTIRLKEPFQICTNDICVLKMEHLNADGKVVTYDFDF